MNDSSMAGFSTTEMAVIPLSSFSSSNINSIIFMIYPIDAFSIMFLSNDCAVDTSEDVTKALIGLFCWPLIVSAN